MIKNSQKTINLEKTQDTERLPNILEIRTITINKHPFEVEIWKSRFGNYAGEIYLYTNCPDCNTRHIILDNVFDIKCLDCRSLRIDYKSSREKAKQDISNCNILDAKLIEVNIDIVQYSN